MSGADRKQRPWTLFKFLWEAHKVTGLILSLALVLMATTGFLLIFKKDVEWIQPATRKGAEGTMEQWIPMQKVVAAVLERRHPDFKTVEDIDRVDFRPGRRVHKVRSKHNQTEMQVDAVTGDVLKVAPRRSDLIEDIHDGSFFAKIWHDVGMPLVAMGLIFLAGSGWYLWLAPKLRRRRKQAP